ncbi:MAG: ParB/RepB/Spo0J family partition protein [Planctomycetota bacterium]
MAGRKLGRGLDVLIAGAAPIPAIQVLQIPTEEIEPNPYQPRREFPLEELEALKTSIAREGFLQPVVVRKLADGKYQLVVGERRLRAAQDLGLETVPALLASVEDDRLLELALVENVQREDLNPIELANGYRQLMRIKGWTQEVLAESLGLSRSSVSNTLRLLDLPEDIRNAIARGQITMGHAKVLLSVGDAREQRVLFERIAEEKLTVRDLEEERQTVAEAPEGSQARKKGRGRPQPQLPPHVQSLADELSEALATRVRIRERAGKGRVIIEFYSPEDFERIREILLGRGRKP